MALMTTVASKFIDSATTPVTVSPSTEAARSTAALAGLSWELCLL